jgi:hypothetical protein
MCMFCAAVPVAGTAVAVAKGKQQEKIDDARLASQADTVSVKSSAMLLKLSLVVMILLIGGSVIYHTVVAPRLGIW